ncbi:MAG: hypothetical protein MUE61_18415, partial [Vicinamibacterales bacterium]|nr:hypothetical protein [Vicinamibacterales bacterium]
MMRPTAHIVRRYDALNPAVVVEDAHLRREPVRQVRAGVRRVRAKRRRRAGGVFAQVAASRQVSQADTRDEISPHLPCGILHCAAAQHRRPRRRRHPARRRMTGVHLCPHQTRIDAGDVAQALHHRGVEALAHLGESGVN